MKLCARKKLWIWQCSSRCSFVSCLSQHSRKAGNCSSFHLIVKQIKYLTNTQTVPEQGQNSRFKKLCRAFAYLIYQHLPTDFQNKQRNLVFRQEDGLDIQMWHCWQPNILFPALQTNCPVFYSSLNLHYHYSRITVLEFKAGGKIQTGKSWFCNLSLPSGGERYVFAYTVTQLTPFTLVTCVRTWKECVVSSGSFLGHAHVTLALMQLDHVCGVLASEVTFSVGVTCPSFPQDNCRSSDLWAPGPEVKTQMKSKSELTNSHETA